MCQIGDENPIIWTIKKVKNSLSKPSKHVKKNYRLRSGYGSLNYNIKTGEHCGDEHRSHEDRKSTVSISLSSECENKDDCANITVLFNRWTDDGMTIYKTDGPHKISSIDTFENEVLPLFMESLYDLIKFAQRGTYCCSGCGKEKDVPPVGRHFAGVYCKPCYESYKRKHSGRCLKCKDYRYRCCC
jgi:hypothetical protein